MGCGQTKAVWARSWRAEWVTRERLGTDSKICNKGTMVAQQFPTLVLYFLCCLPVLSIAQQKSPDGAKILALEQKWTESYKHHDITILSSLLAEDFVITIEDGSTFGK
jgi:hypothetical protein